MKLLDPLLQAIVRVDGDSLVLPAVDSAYLVVEGARVALSGLGVWLTADDVARELLPAHLQSALEDVGAVQCELPAMAAFPGDRFAVVASHSPEGLQTEIRRVRVPDDFRLPGDLFESRTPSAELALLREAAAMCASPDNYAEDDLVSSDMFARPGAPETLEVVSTAEAIWAADECFLVPDANQLWPAGMTATA